MLFFKQVKRSTARTLRLFPVWAFVSLQSLPIVVVAWTSFKTPLALLELDLSRAFDLETFFLGNYYRVLVKDDFLDFLFVSTCIALLSTLVSILTGSLAAYALARFPFRFSRPLSLSVLCARMIPPVALALPLSIMLRHTALNDSVLGLVVAHTTFNLPFAIWLLLPFFSNLPKEYEEAASLDGMTDIQIFLQVIVPLARPGIFVTAIFCFLMSWNDFLFSLILGGSASKTAPLVIHGYMTSDRIEWGAMTASSMLLLLPAFALCLALQRHISGIQTGGIKG